MSCDDSILEMVHKVMEYGYGEVIVRIRKGEVFETSLTMTTRDPERSPGQVELFRGSI